MNARAAWLSDDVLLVALRGAGGRGEPRVQIRAGEEVEARYLPYANGTNALLTTRLPAPPDRGEELGTLVLRFGTEEAEAVSVELDEAICDLKVLARTSLAALDGRSRSAVLEFLARTLVEHTVTANAPRLHRSLFLLREAVRERLPATVMSHDEDDALALEAVLAVDERSFYLQGWLHDEGRAERLTAVAPEGFRTEIAARLFRHPRADVEQFYGGGDSAARHGFSVFVELDGPSVHPAGWTLELWTSPQTGIEARGPRAMRDPIDVRNTILADLVHEPRDEETLLREHVFPAISRIQERTTTGAEIDRVVEFGSREGPPMASIVVPVYRRIDFLEHQLAQFALDRELWSADLIFALDSPALVERTQSLLRSLHELYRVPFRLATLTAHSGYAGVNNLGASLAESRLLLLLNSDVFPDRPGWLGTMTSFYDSTPGIGALGAKLLYEDDSLQHAGMSFVREPGSPLWENAHYFKGLHRRLERANVARPVPSVTGACLMIDRELYHRVGGLRGTYVGGDNEDSDLCLRLLAEGFQNWYAPDAELYHLEGQSIPEGQRALTKRYNDWLQTRELGSLIKESVRESELDQEPLALMAGRRE